MEVADRRRALLLTAPVVAAGVFLFVRLARDVSGKPVHEDEAAQGLISARPLGEVLAASLSDQGFAPLHFVLAHAVLILAASPAALRWLSVAFALGAVALCCDIGRRLGGPIAGITAGLLAATSQLLGVYGTIGRMYALLAFAAALAADLFIRALVLRTPGAAALAAAGAWVLAATHPFGMVIVVCEAAVGLALWRGRPLRSALPVALVALAFVPLLVAQLRLADRFAVRPGGDTALASPEVAVRLLVRSIGGLAGGREPALLLFVALAGIGLVTLVRRRPGFAAFATLALLITPLLLVLGQTEGSIAQHLETRHLIYGLPFWTGLVGVGTARVLEDRGRAMAILGVTTVALVALFAPNVAPDPRDLRSGTRGATAEPAAWLSTQIEPGDVLFPGSPVFLAALPEAGRAVPLLRGSPTLDRPVFERMQFPVGSLFLAIPLDFAGRVDATRLQARLGPTCEVRVFDSWLLLAARGPFTDRLALAEAGALGMAAAEQSVETSSPRLARYFSQSLRTLCGVVRSLGGGCPVPP
ncbi:MAG TPA: hypothetical protein VD695_02325 [Gaiellaceae bacterium]|nr:hypothetical protein [Gaiellaceae bacterium]